jgi:hypothetical protein
VTEKTKKRKKQEKKKPEIAMFCLLTQFEMLMDPAVFGVSAAA